LKIFIFNFLAISQVGYYFFAPSFNQVLHYFLIIIFHKHIAIISFWQPRKSLFEKVFKNCIKYLSYYVI